MSTYASSALPSDVSTLTKKSADSSSEGSDKSGVRLVPSSVKLPNTEATSGNKSDFPTESSNGRKPRPRPAHGQDLDTVGSCVVTGTYLDDDGKEQSIKPETGTGVTLRYAKEVAADMDQGSREGELKWKILFTSEDGQITSSMSGTSLKC